jgi:predicted alpha/beta-fold hydrolase
LRHAHLQTIAGNFLPRTNLLPPGERRVFVVEEGDGGKVQVECLCHWQESGHPAIGPSGDLKPTGASGFSSPDDPITRSPNSLTVIIVHGLEGSVDSQYVIGTGSKAWAAGMNVVRMNMRNCGGTEKLTPTLYHSGLSADVGAVAEELIREDGLERIAIVGFSMGGNLVMKLAGEWSNNVPPQVKAFATVSPAMDLAASADALHSWQNWLYERRFLRGLRRRFRRKAELFPERYDIAHLRRFPSIREFDDKITARYEGFAGAADYYERASSSRVADKIRVPTLVIHAKDDPFIRLLPQTRAKLLNNPAVRFVETEHGGHCAFLAEPNGYDGRWAERMIVEFLAKSS